jgi:hypothetical protein
LSRDGGRVFFSSIERLAATDTDDSVDVYRASLASLPQAPLAVTDPADEITATEVELRATVSPRGAETVYLFEYGPTTSYGQFTGGAFVTAGSPPTAVSMRVGNLAPGTVHHYRVRAASSEGTAIGADRMFTTSPSPAPAPAAPTPPGGAPQASTTAPVSRRRAPSLLGSRTLRVRRGIAIVKLSCGAATACRGSARLASAARRGRTLGTARYRIGAGKRARIRIRLTAAGKRLVTGRRLRAILTLRETGAPPRRIALTLRRSG